MHVYIYAYMSIYTTPPPKPATQVLSMYGTPFSLHKNYRHHVVNTVTSLRTLDDYVIADDEIIEDARFAGVFARYHPQLHLPAVLHNVDPVCLYCTLLSPTFLLSPTSLPPYCPLPPSPLLLLPSFLLCLPATIHSFIFPLCCTM